MKNETEALKAAIMALENQSAEEFVALKEQFNVSLELFRPVNLIKSALQEVTTSPDMKDAVVNSLTGITAGFFTKKLFVGSSTNPLKQMFGTIIQFATASIVSKHVVDIRTIGHNIVSRLLKSKEDNYAEH
jgi:hypothetical protein